eukprot:gene21847-8490_t
MRRRAYIANAFNFVRGKRSITFSIFKAKNQKAAGGVSFQELAREWY